MSDPGHATAGPLVVSVEDNPADVRLIEEGVAAVGVDLQVYNNGEQALDRLLDGEAHPPESVALVLLDMNIPRVSGLEILQALRESPEFGSHPIVVMSSSESPTDIGRVYEDGANAYVTKPTDPDEFIQAVTAAVRFWIPSTTNAGTHE